MAKKKKGTVRGKIKQSSYIDNLKTYWDTQTKIFSETAEKAITISSKNMDIALTEIKSTTMIIVQEAIVMTSESALKLVTNCINYCQKNTTDTLEKMKELEVNKEITAFTTNQVIRLFEETMERLSKSTLAEEYNFQQYANYNLNILENYNAATNAMVQMNNVLGDCYKDIEKSKLNSSEKTKLLNQILNTTSILVQKNSK